MPKTRIAAATLVLLCTSAACQPTWTEQPVLFLGGFTVGWTFGEKTKPIKLGLTLAAGKAAYDLGMGRRPEPAALGIGAWIGGELRRDTRKKPLK